MRDGFLSGLDKDIARAAHEAAGAGIQASLGEHGENPSDPAILDLLEEIVYHTLESGRPQEAWDIYWNRIGGYRNLSWRLGDYRRGERICRAFAAGHPPTSAPLPEGLSENQEAIWITEWGLYLKPLGYPFDAAVCDERCVDSVMKRGDWKNASRGQQNRADALLLTGRLAAGLAAAEQALALAERASDDIERGDSHAYRGHARGLRGDVNPALDDFRAALEFQHKADGKTEHPLYSGRGVQHTGLLARLGRNEEARRLTEANIRILRARWGEQDNDVPSCRLLLASLAACRT